MRTVYFLQASSGPIKIGITKNLVVRLKSLDISNYATLKLIHSIETQKVKAMWIEEKLHRIFKDACIKGEWFRPEQDLLNSIAQIKRVDIWEFLYARLGKIPDFDEVDLTPPLIPTDYAEIAGVHPSNISHVNAGRRHFTVEQAVRVMDAAVDDPRLRGLHILDLIHPKYKLAMPYLCKDDDEEL